MKHRKRNLTPSLSHVNTTALKRFGTGAQLVPDQLDTGLSYGVVSYLKKLKQQVSTYILCLVSLEI